MLTREHFEQMHELESRAYPGEYITPAAEAHAWYLRLPQSTVACLEEGRVVGFVNLFPVTDEVFVQLKAGVYNDANLRATDIVVPGETSGSAGQLHLFLSCFLVDEAHRGRGLARRLVAEAVAAYAPFADRIDEVVGDAVTPAGERFMGACGLERLRPSDHGSTVYLADYPSFARAVARICESLRQ